MVCSTESGPTPGLPCIFPFKLDGVAYHTCKLDEKDGSRWCSTKIDESGQHLQGNWGNCGSDCGEHIIYCRDSNIISCEDSFIQLIFPYSSHIIYGGAIFT